MRKKEERNIMEEAKICQITPGMCPPEGCPPPTRIYFIFVYKVYDSCFQINDITRDTTISDFTPDSFSEGDVIPCAQNGDITCSEISAWCRRRFFTVTIFVSVLLTLTNPMTQPKQLTNLYLYKTATLCCPPVVSPDCSKVYPFL